METWVEKSPFGSFVLSLSLYACVSVFLSFIDVIILYT